MTDPTEDPFGHVTAFEWDEQKRASNFQKHGIDFSDLSEFLDGDLVVGRSDREGEVRFELFGVVEGQVIAAVCTVRGNRCRWISARPARRDERKRYHSRVPRLSPQG